MSKRSGRSLCFDYDPPEQYSSPSTSLFDIFNRSRGSAQQTPKSSSSTSWLWNFDSRKTSIGIEQTDTRTFEQSAAKRRRVFSESPEREYFNMASNFDKNAISAFEEYGVKHGRQPTVSIEESVGPSHQPVFMAVARLGDREVSRAYGSTKHEARTKAAAKALNILNVEDRQKADKEVGSGDSENCVSPVPGKNPVSALQEYSQAMRLGNPDFNLVSQEGPPHMPVFTMEVKLENRTFASIKARSRKEAKKMAAIAALQQLHKEGQLSKWVSTPTPTDDEPSQSQSSTSSTSPAARNAISELNEFSQKNCKPLRFQKVSQYGPSHKPVFGVQVFLGKREFDPVEASSMKGAKVLAAQRVLDILRDEQLYVPPADVKNDTNDSSSCPATFNGRLVATAHSKVDKLMLKAPLVGRKVVAAIVMTTGNNSNMTVVSVGSGNRCLKGDQLRHDGKVIHDSHAEVLAVRGFKRYLYKLLKDQPDDILMIGNSGKLKFQDGIDFHLYISTAPCGDGALFVHSDKSDYYKTDSAGESHLPVFTNSKTQGLLRVKQENGEGTIPIEAGLEGQTFDGIQRGERLRVMSCSDKICRWNVLGLQGALLSTVFEPVYLKSIVLGNLYHHGHLSRAVCCRVDRESTAGHLVLPPGYRVNHPNLGLVSMEDGSRSVAKSSALCLNWCIGDNMPEITDGTTGMTHRTMSSNMTSSQLCKDELFRLYTAHVRMQPGFTYGLLKQDADDYNQAKLSFKKYLKTQGYGIWIEMPKEVDRFY